MPNYFKPDWLDDWKTERKKGALRYLLINSIGLAIICAVFDLLVNKRNLLDMSQDRMIVNGAIFLGGGLFYAVASWFYNEYKFKKEG